MEPTSSSLAEQHQSRPPLYRDAVVIKWVVQVVTLLVIVAGFWFLATQATSSLAAKGIELNFDFLNTNPGIQLSDGIDTNPNTGGRALWAGMVNTLRMAGAGILCATILGVLVGLARLSHNWVVNKIGSIYVETIRNIPLLVQIIVWGVVITGLPDLRNYDDPATELGPIPGWLYVSNKGFAMPRFHIADGFYQWMIVMFIGAVVARFVFKNRTAKRDAEGGETYPGSYAFGVLVVFGIIGLFVHQYFAFVGGILQVVSDAVANLPQALVQLVLSAIMVALSARWIRNFFANRRTPGGSARLTDDDWFRVIFSAFGALLGIVVVWIIWPGLSSWIINSGSDLFQVLADKFDSSRTGGPFGFEKPNIIKTGNFPNYGPDGLNLSSFFAAVFLGVTLYTAAFIAEIVRGGILAVPKGQTEAAAAMGLSKPQALRKVVLPQAFRVILPPLGNQYLNLTKNTSLAIAVGYSDLVQVGQTIGSQSGKFLSILPIWMAFYLVCSLLTSAVVNYFNVRMAIVER